MCELQSQLVACKVCSAENKRLRETLELVFQTLQEARHAPTWMDARIKLETLSSFMHEYLRGPSRWAEECDEFGCHDDGWPGPHTGSRSTRRP